MNEGWEGQKRVHYCLIHVEIRADKLGIHYNGIEDGITDELVEGGVPENRIVLAFHSPEVRKHTGFAISIKIRLQNIELTATIKLNIPWFEPAKNFA